MYPEVSDDELLYLVRRNNKKAYKMLLNRYSTFILKWLSEYKLTKSEKEHLHNQCLLFFEETYQKYDESKGLFYSYIQLVMKRFIQSRYNSIIEFSKIFETYDSDDYIHSKSLVLNDAVYYELNNEPAYEYIYIFSEIENKIIRLRVEGNSYKKIAELNNISIKKVEYILTKYRKYKKAQEQKKSIF